MKKSIYLLAVIILMTMLSFLIHMLVRPELVQTTPQGAVCTQTTIASLPWMNIATILLPGLLLGYLIGQYRRRIVYIERKHRWFKRQDAKNKKK